MLALRYGAATDPGRVRRHNEDAVLASPYLFAVADGMGGHAAGEVAAGLAVDRLGVLAGRADLTPDDLRAAIEAAGDEIVAAARGGRRGMGTTVAGLAAVQLGGADHWVVFNVGDSRVYRLAGGRLGQLTVDHSEVEEMVEAGRLSRAEAREHPLRNMVTRSLGSEPRPVADLWVIPSVPGERFVVCSDGLPQELDDSDIEAVLLTVDDAQQAADLLVARAVGAGGRDNVTVVVVDLPLADAAAGSPGADVATVPRTSLAGDRG
jgi:serine/threonine protein phosphatase PrpC